MSLTSDDKSWIKNAITSGIVDALNEVVVPRFEVLEGDAVHFKSDIAQLKGDNRNLRSDIREVKQSLSGLDGRVEAVESDIKEIYYMLANRPKGVLC